MIYEINYELKKPGQNYEGLQKAIQDLGNWWHYLGSTLLVDTSLSANDIWDRLAPHVDRMDWVLVIGVTQDYQGWLSEGAGYWINDRAGRLAA